MDSSPPSALSILVVKEVRFQTLLSFEMSSTVTETQGLAQIMRRHKHLGVMYDNWRKQANQVLRIDRQELTEGQNRQTLEILIAELTRDLAEKNTTIQELLKNQKTLHSLDLQKRWFNRIKRYGGREKFFQDVGQRAGIEPVLKLYTPGGYYTSLSRADWQKLFKEKGINYEKPVTIGTIRVKIVGIGKFINKVGIKNFASLTGLQLIQTPPEGWLNYPQIEQALKKEGFAMDRKKRKPMLSDLIKEKPQSGGVFVNSKGKACVFYSPQTIEELKKISLRNNYDQREKIDSTQANEWIKNLQL